MNVTAEAALICLALCAGVAWYSGYKDGAADAKAQIAKAVDANASCTSTITSLEQSVAQCELNRTLDLTAQAGALAERDQAQAARDKTLDAALSKLHERMTHECVDWAKQPACGSVP